MQRQTFEANRDMAFIAVTHDAGIFLSGRKSREENRIKSDDKTYWCVETIKEVYQAIHYCIFLSLVVRVFSWRFLRILEKSLKLKRVLLSHFTGKLNDVFYFS